MRPDAVMLAVPETNMARRSPMNIESLRIFELALVAVRGLEQQEDALPGL